MGKFSIAFFFLLLGNEMAEPVNVARIVFGNPTKGIISCQGFNSEFSGKQWDRFLSRGAIAGRHGEVKKENLFYEKNSQTIILKPNLELASMDGSGYTTGGLGEEKWERRKIPGQPDLTLEYQYNVKAENWEIESDSDIKANQGFILYWMKMVTPEGLGPNLTITFGSGSATFIFYLQPRKKMGVTRIILGGEGGEIETSEEWSIGIPESYFPTDSPFTQLNILTGLIVDDCLILGFGGLDNAIALKCTKYYLATDVNGKEYPQITTDETSLKIKGSGAGLFGFKKLTYETQGGLSTPLMFPGYVLTEPPKGEISKKIIPSGTSIELKGFSGGGDAEGEGQPQGDAEKQGVYANVILKGDGNTTPYLYRFKISQAPSRITMTGPAQELDTDILSYEESVSGSKDGSFMGASASVLVTCSGQFYPNLFGMKSPQVQYNLKLRGQEAEFLRATHIVDIKEAQRPEFGKFALQIESRDITKELEMDPLLESESYDGRKWRHGDLMKELASKGGVGLICGDYSADPILPDSEDTNSPNWQFHRGTKIWEAMQKVREYSGWLLYPDNNGKLIYKPRPSADDSEDYTLDANSDSIRDLTYKLIDLYRTRILVWGKAAEDYKGEYPYKKGDNLLGAGYHKGLEEQIGRSRPLILIDPLLSDWDSIKKMVDALYDYYTKDPFYISFQINDFENYGDMWIYKIIKWSDSKINWEGSPLADKKFLITGINPRIDKFTATAMVEAVIL